MGEYSTLMARDGHEFQAWLAAPPARPRGALVVIQEIFGVNRHIRTVTDAFAAEGYTAIAPCLFDRVRRGIELDYSPAAREEGAGYAKQLPPEVALRDVAAARAAVRHSGRAATVGYCWGGTLSYLAACELQIACAVVYYGRVVSCLDKKPKCPVMYHYGSRDPSIPPADVERIRAAANPRSILHVYEGAGHAFNCDLREAWHREAAALARTRTLDFLSRYLGGERVHHEAARS
jgi:carboxymethylenebutenolidase